MKISYIKILKNKCQIFLTTRWYPEISVPRRGALTHSLNFYKFSQLIRNKMIAKFRIKTAELIANIF